MELHRYLRGRSAVQRARISGCVAGTDLLLLQGDHKDDGVEGGQELAPGLQGTQDADREAGGRGKS